MSGLALQIDGCEYLFATSGVTTMPTSTDSNWPGDLRLLQHALEWPKQTITERCRPLDGDVDVSGLTFKLHDITPSNGEASGRAVITYLGTRGTLSVTSTLLDDVLDDTVDVVTVQSTTGFAAAGAIYIDREAITYASKTATTFEGCTRGAYGSKPEFHIYEPDYSFSSAVWTAFPGFEGRRVVLYLVDAQLVARVLWIGRIKNGPRTSGAMYEFQCDHIWASEREQRLGANTATCSVSGFDPSEIRAAIQYSGAGFVDSSTVLAPGVQPIRETLDEALDDVRSALTSVISTLAVDIAISQLAVTAEGIAFSAVTNVGQMTAALLTVGGSSVYQQARENADRRHPTVTFAPIPSSLARINVGATSTLPVSDGSTLPASWAAVTTSSSPHTTSVQNVLVADYAEDVLFVMEPTTVTTSASPHTVTGYGFLVPMKPSAVPATTTGTIHLDHEMGMRSCPRVTTTHWLDGFRYGIATSSSVVSTGLDIRNWEWTRANRALAASGSVFPDRIWYLDGRRTVADLVRSNMILDGVALGIKYGRVSPFALTPPLASDVTAATFTAGDQTAPTTWERNPDGIVNTVDVECAAGRVVFNNQLSRARFGEGRAIKLKIDGTDDARLARADPREIVSSALGHLNNFAEPTFVRKLSVSLEHATDVWIGDYVTVTDWATPNGSGGRGPSGIVCQVIGREISLSPGAKGGMVLELLSYWQGLLYGIAPCCRVTSIAAAVLNINVGYLGETSTPTDYADSTSATYPFTFGDGGASWFAVNDVVKLIRRDVTTVTQETGLQVLSVSPGAGTSTITLTSAPVTVVGGAIVDVVFDNYGNGSATTSNMEDFAWTGDYSGLVIGTSTDPVIRWSP